MKKYLLSFLVLYISGAFAQDITFIPQDTLLTDTLGAEMVFYIDLTNISAAEQTIFMVRTQNDLPQDWSSSLCFESCFPGWIDSVVTNGDFGSTPLQPNETREVAVHVFALNNVGTANVQIQAGTMRNSGNRITVDLTAIANYTDVEDENNLVNNYFLEQNFPNPFNPSTKINFGLKKSGNVEISLYNILGSKVSSIFNGYKDAGKHSVLFDGSGLSSGIYFYKISSNDFTQTKKMILEK